MSNENKPLIAVVMGSVSDKDAVAPVFKTLEDFGISYTKHVYSAHRAPDLVAEFAKAAESKGYKAIIGCAGMAAALPGAIKAYTTVPVVGLPISGANDPAPMAPLLAMTQMPPGEPVLTVAINGAANAALGAIEIVATSDESVRQQLRAYKQKMLDGIIKANGELNK
ncbi:MAG: AIR carboxylase family protein [Rickettsiales bacterium]|jgi:5-(carboxyamino)imidazole ribonucleotide mutase|nr:AIR carboxylase family protein [Rickettsiales bacterium]